jgi:hypothetical protein
MTGATLKINSTNRALVIPSLHGDRRRAGIADPHQ